MIGEAKDMIGRFVRAEHGSATVEFALLLPFLMGLVMLVTDISMIMYHKGNADRIVQDTNRLRSTGALTTNDMAVQYMLSRLTRADGRVIGNSASGVQFLTVISAVNINISEVDVFGLLPPLIGDMQIVVRNQQALEYMEI